MSNASGPAKARIGSIQGNEKKNTLEEGLCVEDLANPTAAVPKADQTAWNNLDSVYVTGTL
jgi:hypothetical protein